MAKANRSAREPAEDAVRRIVAACEDAGLVITSRLNQLVREKHARIINVEASPAGWPHKLGMLSVLVWMDLSGNLGPMSISCRATDDDPKVSIWDAVRVHDVLIRPEDLPQALSMVLEQRETVRERLASGQKPPFADLHWRWDVLEWVLPHRH